MFLAGFDDDFRVADLLDFRRQHGAKVLAGLGWDTAGAAIGDNAFGVDRGEGGAGSDVAGLEIDAEAERFEDAAANLEFERVITEQPEMAGTAAGRDAGRDGNHSA